MATVLLTSCATAGKQFDLKRVDQLVIGTTTMNEVRAMFGSPQVETNAATWRKRMHFGDEAAETIWRYEYAWGAIGGFAQQKVLHIEFNNEGRIADYYYVSDFVERAWT